jgi:hypothetical protein
MLNGAEYVVEAVATSPTLDVCVAERSVQGERLESQHLARVLLRYESETVPDEQEVELSSFARVRDRLENRKVLAAGRGSRKPPARHVIPVPTA